MFEETSQLAVISNPHEEALQSLCKQLLKSRLFRGYYVERRHVEILGDYRDIIMIDRNERDLEKLLLYVRDKLQLFYLHKPDFWVGITHGPSLGVTIPSIALDTCIWAELEDLAFGHYWFLLKSVRFRDNEIILKLKVMRPYEEDFIGKPSGIPRVTRLPNRMLAGGTSVPEENVNSDKLNDGNSPQNIALDDFINLLQHWGNEIKRSVYDFMSHDINKENIVSCMQFVGLFLVTVLSGALVAIKYLGIFTLRFMFEFSRFTHVITPIILKFIDVVNKVIGGFYILVAMIWKDMVVNRDKPKQPVPLHALQYNRPPAKSIEYYKPTKHKPFNSKFQ